MKKAALFMACALAVTALAGCSSSSSTAETTAAAGGATEAAGGSEGGEVNMIMTWWGNQVRNERTQQALDLYAEQNPGVHIEGQFSEWSDYWNKLATSAAGQAMPDLLQMDYMYVDQYVKSGLLLDLTPYIEDGTLDTSNISENTMASGTVDGGVYAICAGINSPALLYNKTLTDSLGIEIKDNMTLDEFMDVSRQIYEKSGVKTDLAFGNAESMMTYIMRGEGVDNMFAENAFSMTGEDAFVPFFEIYETGYNEGWMLDAGIFAELTVNSVEQCPLVYYSTPETQSWCACYWSNQLTAMQQSAPEGVELAYSTWPAADPVKADFLHPSMFFSVAAGSDNLEESVKVLNYLINDVECNNVLLAERGIPAPSAVTEAISDKLPEESQKEIAFIEDVVTPNSSTISPCPPSGATEVFSLADDLVEQVLYGATTAQDASARLFNDGNKILAD